MSLQRSSRKHQRSRKSGFLDKAALDEENDDELKEISVEQWRMIARYLARAGLAPIVAGLTQAGIAINTIHQSNLTMFRELITQIGIYVPMFAIWCMSTFKYMGAAIISFYTLYMAPLLRIMGASVAKGWNELYVFLFLTESTPWAQKVAPIVEAWQVFISACGSTWQTIREAWQAFSSACGSAWQTTRVVVGVPMARGWNMLVVPFFEAMGVSIEENRIALLVSIAQVWNASVVPFFQGIVASVTLSWKEFIETPSTPWAQRIAPLVKAWKFCVSGWNAFLSWTAPMLASAMESITQFAIEFQKESEQSKQIKAYIRDSFTSTVNMCAGFFNSGIQSRVAATAVGVWYILFGGLNFIAPHLSLATAGYFATSLSDPALAAVRHTAVIDLMVGAVCMAAAKRDTPVFYEVLVTINVVIGGSDILLAIVGLATPLSFVTALGELIGAAWITWAVKRDQELNRNVLRYVSRRGSVSRKKRSSKSVEEESETSKTRRSRSGDKSSSGKKSGEAKMSRSSNYVSTRSTSTRIVSLKSGTQ